MRLGLELIVIGGGGHAKVVISSLHASGWKVCAIYDDDSRKWNQSIMGIPNHRSDRQALANPITCSGYCSRRRYVSASI